MSADSHHEADVFRLAGSTLDGRFVVDRAIAEGGFGLVYRARQVALDRPVAVKVLKTPPDLGERAREQFLEVFAG
jgi:serine/threonine-protein kinase